MAKTNSDTQVSDLINSTVGLEVETHRINARGELSRHDYPHGLLDEKQHHFIKNDFLETQSELITPPTTTTQRALNYLGAYHQALRGELAEGEYLWPNSMPPKLRADHSDIIIAHTDQANYEYRQKVARIRKIERTAETGVHVNVGLTAQSINQLSGKRNQAAVDQAYLQAAVGFMQYRWLLTYLFGATPLAFGNYFAKDTPAPAHPVRSLRNSHFGFGNGFLTSYQSVSDYVGGILEAVKTDALIADREYYGSVRLKQTGGVEKLCTAGIAYIELRMFDLDPFEPYGISADAVNLVRLMFAYFVAKQPFDLSNADQEIREAQQLNEHVALEDPLEFCEYQDKAHELIRNLQFFSADIVIPFSAQQLCFKMQERISNPALTPSARMTQWTDATAGRLLDLLVKFAKGYQDDLIHNPTIGFENLSPVEQKAILEKLRQGQNVEIK